MLPLPDKAADSLTVGERVEANWKLVVNWRVSADDLVVTAIQTIQQMSKAL